MTREQYIQDIRSRIVYLPEKGLDMVHGFTRAVSKDGRLSTAEADRPVLTMEQQRCADQATCFMRAVGDALASGELPYSVSDGVVTINVKLAFQAYLAAGWKRVKRTSMIEWLELAGYILPGREALHIPVGQLRPFMAGELKEAEQCAGEIRKKIELYMAVMDETGLQALLGAARGIHSAKGVTL